MTQVQQHSNSTFANREAISVLLNPGSIAFVGASTSPEKMSGQPIRNVIRAGFGGKVYAVNQRGEVIDGIKSYTSIDQIPDSVDLGFITVPASKTPQAVRDLAKKGAKVAVVAVGGFAELGSEEGKKLLNELILASRETGIRLVGPVCNGVYSTHNNLALGYNTIHTRSLSSGSIGLVSHSGAMVGPLLSSIERCGAGLSYFISSGTEADLQLADYVDFLVHDNRTKVIALIFDRIGDGKAFRAVIKEARAAGKPVVALKLGDSSLGRKATLAHSSHLAGARESYEAVLRAEGVLRVPTLESLAFTSAILADGRSARTYGVTACSTSGGGAILLADRLSDESLPVKELAPETIQSISQGLLFDSATIMNPFDLGLGGRDHYQENVGHLARDPGTGVLIGYNTPMATPAKREQLATSFTAVAKKYPTLPVLVLFPGEMADDERVLYEEARIPVLPSTLEACAVIKALLTTAEPVEEVRYRLPEALPGAIAEKVHSSSGSLSEFESKQILQAFGTVLPKEQFVTTLEKALKAAGEIGYPIVLKACGKQISHKSEYRLVEVGIGSAEVLTTCWNEMQERLAQIPNMPAEGFLVAEMVKGGVEVIFGITRDPEFGLIAILGPGGIFTEMLGPAVMGRAPLPLSEKTIRNLIDETPLGRLLEGYRGGAKGDTEALVEQISRICTAAEALGDRLEAMDVNPILVREAGKGALPLDALFILN